MKVEHYTETLLEDVTVEGSKGCKIRWLISQKDMAPNFATRMFEVAPGGFTPYHTHNFEHEVYVLEGEGVFVTEEKEYPFKAGYVLYADPGMKHQFRNAGDSTLKFLCIVPIENPNPIIKEEKEAENLNPFASEEVNDC
ncbi:MAG: cupin domain-containing protein [Candidatus Cloacimonas sp.]|jgi:quercetin dioxygenase-like cupin family protein|nr:cupin domain-containing protein [Candidatus Cloacimonadota bacterium]